MCSSDDVTPVELFLERGLTKAGYFFPFLESYYYSKLFTSVFSSHSLFNSTVLLNLESSVVEGQPAAYTSPHYGFLPLNTIKILKAETTGSEVKAVTSMHI